MTPVDQTRFADGEGDCLVACIATITGVRLADIPHFCAGHPEGSDAWYPAFAEWLVRRGYAPLSLSFDEPEAVDEHLKWARLFGREVAWIASGRTTRGRHFVVYLGDSIYHDPNPNYGRSGLQTIQDATFLLRAAS
jgi:hypothetical protein